MHETAAQLTGLQMACMLPIVFVDPVSPARLRRFFCAGLSVILAAGGRMFLQSKQ